MNDVARIFQDLELLKSHCTTNVRTDQQESMQEMFHVLTTNVDEVFEKWHKNKSFKLIQPVLSIQEHSPPS